MFSKLDALTVLVVPLLPTPLNPLGVAAQGFGLGRDRCGAERGGLHLIPASFCTIVEQPHGLRRYCLCMRVKHVAGRRLPPGAKPHGEPCTVRDCRRPTTHSAPGRAIIRKRTGRFGTRSRSPAGQRPTSAREASVDFDYYLIQDLSQAGQ